MPSGIRWEWVHIRNTSLLQANLLLEGFKSKGYYPVAHFDFDNQLMIYKPGKGVFFFYDADLMEAKIKAIQEDIDSNPSLPGELHEKSASFFRSLKESAQAFQQDLGGLSNTELLRLFQRFRKSITVGPLITVQLYGIEACWDPQYRLYSFLKKRLEELGKVDRLYDYIGFLSASTGKTMALAEKESFLKAATVLYEDAETRKLFLEKQPKEIERKLGGKARQAVREHVKNFRWVHSEYLGEAWPIEKYLHLFKDALRKNPVEELEKLGKEFQDALNLRERIIEELEAPEDMRRVLAALNEFTAQRDWAKGRFCDAFLDYQPFLDELAKRLKCSKKDVLFLSLDEVEAFLDEGRKLDEKRLQERKKGFALLSLKGRLEILTGTGVEKLVREEGAERIFSEKPLEQEVKGLPASTGVAEGRARIITSMEDLKHVEKGDIIITYMTTMEYTSVFHKAAGIVTDEGGLSSHAAIVSREFGLPCIVGTKKATKVFKNGELVELDAFRGVCRKKGIG